MTLADPAQSRAVLIGGSRYELLPSLSSVRNNLGAMAAILRDPGVWGVTEDHCRVVADPKTPAQLVDPIVAAAQAATDMLLIYYAGHGLTNRAGDLQLTIADSDAARAHSQVPYQWVRDPIRDSPARRRVVILDCCYSGRAANEAMGEDSYAAQADVDGSFILTATPENREALAPADQQYTAFTQMLIAVLGEGIASSKALLNLNEIFAEIKARLHANSLPTPQARDRNNLGGQTSFRNKAFEAGAVRSIGASPERRDLASRDALQQVRSACVRASADFLREERLPVHDRLYVERWIDTAVEAAINAVSPVNLLRTHRIAKPKRGIVSGDPVIRAPPPQIMVVSDNPGTGKTMLAVEFSRRIQSCATVLRRGGDPIAEDLKRLTDALGQDAGLDLLTRARVPILVVVDGLDRADPATYQKQLVDTFRFVDALNKQAGKWGPRAYPIALLFTLRDSEWDRWFTVFEGRGVLSFRRKVSQFSEPELQAAIGKYASVFDYELHGDIPDDVLARLSLPLNLRTLSESYEYAGRVSVEDVSRDHILAGYIRRKSELVIGMVSGITADELDTRLSMLAFALIDQRTIPFEQAEHILSKTDSPPAADGAAVLRALIDERVLMRVAHGIRFSHPAVSEYLMAANSVHRAAETSSAKPLVELTARLAEQSAETAAAVRADAEMIVHRQSLDTQRMVERHFRTSSTFASSRLESLRGELASGGATPKADLKSIYGSLSTMKPDDKWHAFFVVVAVANSQPAERILKVFSAAWEANKDRPDRWKLLAKLGERNLLYQSNAVLGVASSSNPRDWETLLGNIAKEHDKQSVPASVESIVHERLGNLVGKGPEWRQTRGLLGLIEVGGAYVTGRVW